jgi:ATP-dependent RNA helicase RhlE
LSFDNFGLIEPLTRAVREEGYTRPTPIQSSAIPRLLEGKDLLGCAQTGTGKTAAFALPILHRLKTTGIDREGKRPIRALVVTPTRELAAQVGECFAVYGRHTGLKSTTVFGGVRQRNQTRALERGVDILVATPGRLLDLCGQGHVHLGRVEVLVLDEADRMLDMGFIRDIRKIVAKVPPERQTMLFSATMPSSILNLAHSILRDPIEVRIAPEAPAADTIDQTVYMVERNHKQDLLHHLLVGQEISRALVFTRTKRGADRVLMHLQHAKIPTEVIHSDRTQSAREKALEAFKAGKIRVLVASDIAARGLDVDDISHVINYDIPEEAETYVHRIGRTGRAGQEGRALSFCGLDERDHLRAIERLLKRSLTVAEEHPFKSAVPARPAAAVTAATRAPSAWRKLRRPSRGRSLGWVR